jgi:uncharacterized MnhB-related membrane protein
MVYILIVAVTLVCAIEALLAERLLVSALWLAGCSALVALLLYMLGAAEVAVIELSVGAGLVTVLFVFAINIAGDEPLLSARPIIPMPIATGIIVVALIALGLFSLPGLNVPFLPPVDSTFFNVIWEDRSLDLLLQIVLIFAGVLGILGLLGSGKKDLNKEQDQ